MYLYAGEQWDPDLGLYYNRARYLSVDKGRFWNQDDYEGDPESPTSLHKYLYAGGNPVNSIDPSGNVELSIAGFTVNITVRLVLNTLAGAGLFYLGLIGGAQNAIAPTLDTIGDNVTITRLNEFSAELNFILGVVGGIAVSANAIKVLRVARNANAIRQVQQAGSLQRLAKYSELIRDEEYTINRHTQGGKIVQKDLSKGREAHVFNDNIDLKELEKQVWLKGEYNGNVRGFDRFSYRSPTPIGKRIQGGKPDVDLYYIELKGKPTPNGEWKYHLVPRSKPAAGSEP